MKIVNESLITWPIGFEGVIVFEDERGLEIGRYA